MRSHEHNYAERRAESCIRLLKDGDIQARARSAKSLGEIGDEGAIPALTRTLKDSDIYVRWESAIALGKIGHADSVPALIETLKDSPIDVSIRAIEALGAIGDATAIPGLVVALKDSNLRVCRAAADALGRIGGAAVVPALIEALKDRVLRQLAARALGKIGDAHTLPSLVLSCTTLTSGEKLERLQVLRGVMAYGTPVMRFPLPTVHAFCQSLLGQADVEDAARAGAEAVLVEIRNRGDAQSLVRGATRDTSADSAELPRAVTGGPPSAADEHLRPSQPPAEKERS